MKALLAQARVEVVLTLRRGESVVLALGIPVLLLGFFSLVDVLPTGTGRPVDFLAPGVLALAVMSTAMVGLGIATGFERQYGVLKRLGATPLGRPRLLWAKTMAILGVEAVQAVVLVVVAVALGWHASVSLPGAVAGVLVATVAFAGIGLVMAGTMRAEMVLAAANGLYVVLLLLGGMVVPLGKLPTGLRAFARLLPAAALSDVLHASLGSGHGAAARAWLVLVAWAVVAPLAAAATFSWE